MRVILAAVTGILFCLHLSSAADTIPDVKTLADLRKLPAIHTDTGYDVRVGMADPGNDAGPYRILYCLAKRTADAPEKPIHYHGSFILGPLAVEVIEPKTAIDKLASLQQSAASESTEQLFIEPLPTGWTDDAVVRLLDGDKTLLERKLGKADQRPMYWSGFARRAVSQTKPSVVDPKPWPACPGSTVAGRIGLDVATGATTRPVIPEDAPLPGSDTIAPGWRKFLYPSTQGELITLSLENDSFILKSAGPALVESPTDQLLARWWVNGRPVEVPDDNVPATVQHGGGRQPSATRHASVAFDLPKMLGDLKPGDRVGLQLLWSSGTRHLSEHRQEAMLIKSAQITACPVPIPTNRLDFTIDEHLLCLRTH
jgi:hypothetical protein